MLLFACKWSLQYEVCVSLKSCGCASFVLGIRFVPGNLVCIWSLVFLNACCCRCVGDTGLALFCCCCFHVCLRGCVCGFFVACVFPSLWYFLTLVPFLSPFFCFVVVCDVV